MNVRLVLVLVLAATLLNACGSDGTDGDALVGEWIRLRTPTEERDSYVFGADGSFAFDENKPGADPQTEDHLAGTYVATDGVVTATAINRGEPPQVRLTSSYHANATQFSSAALHPVAAHNGIIGTWTGVRKLEILDDTGQSPTGVEIEAELLADGTCRFTSTPFDGTSAVVSAGTWAADLDGTFRITLGSSAYVFRVLDGEALIDTSYLWQRK
jgi:hypothetical protein